MARAPQPGDELRAPLTLAAGVNENPEVAWPDECVDARNVWERNGKLTQRPGVLGVVGGLRTTTGLATNPVFLVEDNSASTPVYTATKVLTALVHRTAGTSDRWYFGCDGKPTGSVSFTVNPVNVNTCVVIASYWNGTRWVTLHGTWRTGKHLGGTPSAFYFAHPADWATCVVNGSTKYWLRFELVGNALTAGTEIHDSFVATTAPQVLGMHAANYVSGRRFVAMLDYTGSYTHVAASMPNLSLTDMQLSYLIHSAGKNLRASFAAVEQTDELYVAIGGMVWKPQVTPVGTYVNGPASVETADWAIGEGAPYDATTVAMLSAFPRASIICYFQNRLWAAGIEDEPLAIRWGAADGDKPYHNVWPSLAVEYVDQKPTAMLPLGENMVVYTQDSIYLSARDSIDDFGVPHFKFLRMVAGRGCVARDSVVEVNGRHIFLSEDGIYTFDGVKALKCTLSQAKDGSLVDRLATTFSKLNAARRQFASAVHWRKQRVYMLSIPTTGAENDLTIVWDYERDKFWLWDGFDAQCWLADNGPSSDETIYFGDSYGRIFRLGVDPSEVDAPMPAQVYALSAPIGFGDDMHKGMKEVKLLAKNTSGEVVLRVYPNGQAGQYTEHTVDLTDYREDLWGVGKWGTAKWVGEAARFRHAHFKEDGSYFQVEIRGSGEPGKPLSLSQLNVFYVVKYGDAR